mgnify:CR=1 FL=1
MKVSFADFKNAIGVLATEAQVSSADINFLCLCNPPEAISDGDKLEGADTWQNIL